MEEVRGPAASSCRLCGSAESLRPLVLSTKKMVLMVLVAWTCHTYEVG
jgi:hypothetical protein